MFLELFDVCGWTNPHVEADNELVGHHVELSGETALHVGQVDCGEVTIAFCIHLELDLAFREVSRDFSIPDLIFLGIAITL